jgi:hypothetical protein
MFHDELEEFRISKEQVKLVRKICRKDQEKYDNKSHFYRCAVIKLIREEKARLRL